TMPFPTRIGSGTSGSVSKEMSKAAGRNRPAHRPSRAWAEEPTSAPSCSGDTLTLPWRSRSSAVNLTAPSECACELSSVFVFAGEFRAPRQGQKEPSSPKQGFKPPLYYVETAPLLAGVQ